MVAAVPKAAEAPASVVGTLLHSYPEKDYSVQSSCSEVAVRMNQRGNVFGRHACPEGMRRLKQDDHVLLSQGRLIARLAVLEVPTASHALFDPFFETAENAAGGHTGTAVCVHPRWTRKKALEKR